MEFVNRIFSRRSALERPRREDSGMDGWMGGVKGGSGKMENER